MHSYIADINCNGYHSEQNPMFRLSWKCFALPKSVLTLHQSYCKTRKMSLFANAKNDIIELDSIEDIFGRDQQG